MRTSIALMHDELDIDTLYQRRCQHVATQVFKFIKGNGPKECQDMMVKISEVHNAPTRAACTGTLYVLQTCLKLMDNHFAVVGPKIWNQLSSEMKRIDSLTCFKSEMKHFKFN